MGTTKTSSIRSWPLVAAAVALFTIYARTLYRPSFLTAPPPLVMSNDERAHVLKDFFAGAPPNKSNTTAKDTVWAKRIYAPMHVHGPALAAYKSKIACHQGVRALPSA